MNNLQRRWWGRLCGILIIGILLVGAIPAPAHAAGTSISTFYPASRAAYLDWTDSTSTARPPMSAAFPSGVGTIFFYFEYSGARAHSTAFSIVVYDHYGGSFVVFGPYLFPQADELRMAPVDAPGGAYPNGSYYADLEVDGRVAARSDFTVGTGSLPIVPTFYSATQAAFETWRRSTSDARPPMTTTFPSGVPMVIFYFEYSRAKAKSTHYTIALQHFDGSRYATSGTGVLRYARGMTMTEVDPPSGGHYPDGSYHADLLVNGNAVASTDFIVGVRPA